MNDGSNMEILLSKSSDKMKNITNPKGFLEFELFFKDPTQTLSNIRNSIKKQHIVYVCPTLMNKK